MRYNGGNIKRRGEGWQADFSHAYRRYRKQFETLDQAKGWIDGKRLEVMRLGAPIPPAAAEQAAEALAKLPAGVSIRDCVEYWLRSHPADERAIHALVEEFLADRASAGRRPRTLETLRVRLGKFVGVFGDRTPSSVTSAEVAKWLTQWRGRTRTGYHVVVSGFFEQLVRSGTLERNPLRGVPVVSVDDSVPGILTVPQARALLEAAVQVDPRMVGYLAIGLFAGVRTAELDALAWDAIDLDHARVTISPAIAKARRVRHVTLPTNLSAWLRAYPGHGQVSPAPITRRRRMASILERVGFAWPPNALRHSYCSYHLAQYQDATKTAFELGHQQPAVLYAHYRQLVTPEAAAEYWSVYPPGHAADGRPCAR